MHTSYKELNQKIKEAKGILPIGTKWTHYKNEKVVYIILDICIHEEDEAISVIYSSEENPEIKWIRKFESFIGTVEKDGNSISRFIKFKS
ncbi:MAG: DUF1653 domain-containing protein [Candidatus Dojkabacteria bacterium]|nr:DUF1653 domain-containing protein [Candidatus Dojkabacteria bacterium]MDQ7020705.1 DUF1653 domain-containing protein [Candidatus Dojkabacteria bacterium]